MKILLATYWPIPHIGGIWPVMKSIKEQLESKGHEVDLMGKTPDGEAFYIIKQNEQIKRLSLHPIRQFLKSTNKFIMGVDPLLEIDRYCLELSAAFFGIDQYDVIHTQDVFSTRSLSRVKAKNTILVVSVHGLISQEIIYAGKQVPKPFHISRINKTLDWEYYYILDSIGVKSADVIHTSSQWMRTILTKELSIPEEKIVTFKYGINIGAFIDKLSIPTDIERPPGKKVIMTTGRLNHIKGFHHLLVSLGKLKKVRNDWVCWIVGDGIAKKELVEQTKQLGLQKHVQFLSARNDVPSLLNKADIFVLPSIKDNMPLAVIEAQVSGTPVVVSDGGGLPEMVEHGITGLIAPVGDTEILYTHLKTLLENEFMRNTMALNTKNSALTNWSIDWMMENLIGIYRG
jgi:glycosyltransferase involved in cell wall biosynthesis